MIAEEADKKKRETTPTTWQRIFYFALPVLVIVGALVAYKSSSALTVIGRLSLGRWSVCEPAVAAYNRAFDELESCGHRGSFNLDLGNCEWDTRKRSLKPL